MNPQKIYDTVKDIPGEFARMTVCREHGSITCNLTTDFNGSLLETGYRLRNVYRWVCLPAHWVLHGGWKQQ